MKVYVLVSWDRFIEEVTDIQVFADEKAAEVERDKPEDNIWMCRDVWEEEVI